MCVFVSGMSLSEACEALSGVQEKHLCVCACVSMFVCVFISM